MDFALARNTVLAGELRIVRPLKAGGMGAVYVAEQLSTGKLRAVKVLHARLVDDPLQRERFVREARLASRVDSEHVVEILSAGVEPESGTPWIAMELLDGCDLSMLVKKVGPLSREQMLAIAEQFCHGLAAAHREGIVHRDLKPQNIFFATLRSSVDPWVVKILDFGIAKGVAEADATVTAALGSPAWMAPEQTERSTCIKPASDVWALGLLVFWMLTGRPYWRTLSDPNAGLQSLMRELLFEPLESASKRARDLDTAAPFPADLDTWFSRCVNRRIANRFDDAGSAWEVLGEGVPPRSYALPAVVSSIAEVTNSVSDEEPTIRDLTPDTAPAAPPEEIWDEDNATQPSAEEEVGATLESHKIPSQREAAEPARPRRAWWWTALVLGLAAVAATSWLARPDSSFLAVPSPTVRASTQRAVLMTGALAERAQAMLVSGNLDQAERLAVEALAELESDAGRRPPGAPPSLDGARAQRVLTRVALERANTEAPPSEIDGEEALEAHEKHITEALTACRGARSWTAAPEASCCAHDVATHLVVLHSVAQRIRSQRVDDLVERAEAQLDIVPLGACGDEAALRARIRPASSSPVATAATSRGSGFSEAQYAAGVSSAQSNAESLCSRLDGERSHTFTVWFKKDGQVSVAGKPKDAAGRCAHFAMLRAFRLLRFDPTTTPSGRRTATITLR